MAHLWELFQLISGRRQIGMAANPIQPTELAELCRQLHMDLSAWQVRLVYRLDDAVLSVWAKQRPKPKAQANEPAEIPITDKKGVLGLFRGLAAKQAARAKGA